MFEDPLVAGIAVGVSIAIVLGTFASLIVALIRLPPDYLVKPPKKPKSKWRKIGKNALGVLLIVVGVVTYPLPIPSEPIIFAGLLLVDFPGRQKLIQRVMKNRFVQRTISAIRRWAGKPPLQMKGQPA